MRRARRDKGDVMRIAAKWVIVLMLALSAACSKRPEQAKEDAKGAKEDKVLAKVGDHEIREHQLDDVLSGMPQHQQKEFSGARGRMRLLDQLVNRELLVQEAQAMGLDKDPEVRKQLEDFRTGVLLQAYQRKMVESLPQPTPEQVKKYYEEHKQEFVVPARVNASWIKCSTKAECERARKRVVDGKEEFGLVAREVSIDQATAQDGGLLGYFNPVGYVRGLDSERGPVFAKHAFELEAGDVGPVFQWEDGWGFIKVHEKSTERAEPFERAETRISAMLRPSFNDSMLNIELAKLRDKHKVQTFIDIDKELEGKSADELMKLATETSEPHDKIEYYRSLLRKYPHYERADEAQFMIAFVFSEELQDFDKAKPEYEKVIANFPNSQIKESAQYMLQNMGHGKMPSFEDERQEGSAAAPNP
jgi:peptidyl-prolyl cis-trans isomerase C